MYILYTVLQYRIYHSIYGHSRHYIVTCSHIYIHVHYLIQQEQQSYTFPDNDFFYKS